MFPKQKNPVIKESRHIRWATRS